MTVFYRETIHMLICINLWVYPPTTMTTMTMTMTTLRWVTCIGFLTRTNIMQMMMMTRPWFFTWFFAWVCTRSFGNERTNDYLYPFRRSPDGCVLRKLRQRNHTKKIRKKRTYYYYYYYFNNNNNKNHRINHIVF